MALTTAVNNPASTTTRLEDRSHRGEKSSAEETQETRSPEGIRLAAEVHAAFREGSEQFWLLPLHGTSDRSTRIEVATTFQSIAEVAYMVLSVNINDIRAWSKLYGPAPTLALVVLGRKTVWKMQAELLGRPGRPSPNDSGDPDDPSDRGGFGGHDPDGPYLPGRTNSLAEEEYKRTIEAESGRITIAGPIIAQIAVTALALSSLSQTHWVARSSWLFSFVSSLLAVYFASNQAGKVVYLLFGDRLRAWIRGRSKGFDDCVRENDRTGPNFPSHLVRSLVPAPSSVLIVSAPGLLLSASLYFLLIGFGIYLGFTWTRNLDDLAGPDDSRDVFVVYLVNLLFCYGLYFVSNIAHDRQVNDTVRDTVQDSLIKSITRLEISERRHRENRKQREEKNHQRLLKQQLSLSRQMLDHLGETQTLMKSLEENQMLMNSPTWEDSDRRTPLSWAAERGKKLVVLALLGKNHRNVNAKDKFGRTPLMWAAAYGHVAVVRDLLSHGADPFVKDRDGQTALDLARRNAQEPVITLLQSDYPQV